MLFESATPLSAELAARIASGCMDLPPMSRRTRERREWVWPSSVVAVPKAFADLIEYALGRVDCICGDRRSECQSAHRLGRGDRPTSNEHPGAQAAHLSEARATELSRLGKTAGTAQALIGMTSACNDCSELRDTLPQITGHVALLKTEVVGVSRTCHPNGVIQPNEQCD